MPLINYFKQKAKIKQRKERTRLTRAAQKVGYPLETELDATNKKGRFVSAESMARQIMARRTLRARIKRFQNLATRAHAETLSYQEKPVLDKMRERRQEAKRLKQMKKN